MSRLPTSTTLASTMRRVYWPTTGLTPRNRGVLVGWRTQDSICVAAIVDQWLVDQKHLQSDQLEVLGEVRSSVTASERPEGAIDSFNFDIDDAGSLQRVRTATGTEIHPAVILFHPPDERRYRFHVTGPPERGEVQELRPEMTVLDNYSTPADSGDDEVRRVLLMINSVARVQRQMSRLNRDAPLSCAPSRRASLPIKRESGNLTSLIILAFTPLDRAVALLDSLITYRPHILSVQAPSLVDSSHLAAQIHARLRQATQAPREFRQSRLVKSIQERSHGYIRFWNIVWLIINDLILGYCVHQILAFSTPYLEEILPILFNRYGVEAPVSALDYLNSWPVGLKLNTPLSQFYCTTFTRGIVRYSGAVLPLIQDHVSHIAAAYTVTSLFGLTVFLSALRDGLALFALHLKLCESATSFIFRWQLHSLGGLWNLFRGKRWNVLRQRTDSYDYDVDQLLLGTLLFTVSAFLFPTVLAYSALFYTIKLGLVAADRALSIAVKALNEFPLFELMLRIKEPSRLPAGIHFEIVESATSQQATMIRLENSPRSFADIFMRARRKP